MRKSPHEFGPGIRSGKFLEAALLGRPRKFDTGLPIEDAMQKGKLIPLIKNNLKQLMQQTRENQTDNPSYPKRPFLKQLLNDVEDNLATQYNLPGSYEVRVHSTVDTALDLAGIDFWVEIYDEDKDEVISNFKIDLKSNPQGTMGRMADHLYYCDEKIASDEDPKAIFAEEDYKNLVDATAQHLLKEIKRSHVQATRGKVERLQI